MNMNTNTKINTKVNTTNIVNTSTINATTSNSETKKLKIHCDIIEKLDYFIKQKNSQYYFSRCIWVRKMFL